MEIYSVYLSVVLVLATHWSSTTANLRIGAFNVKVFGKAKAEKPTVMDILSKIIRRYDIILIQEIKDVKGTAIKKLLEKVNQDSVTSSYGMIISERVGRSNSKEQYAFFYKNSVSDGIEILSHYLYDDGDETLGDDHFEREPFLVKFYVERSVVKTFGLVALHVRPEYAVDELSKLQNVVKDAIVKFKTDNILILGDLNAGCTYVPKKAWKNIPIRNDPDFHWLISDDVDTTVKASTDCAYDRFILTGTKFQEAVISNSVKTFNFDAEYNLNESEALKVSDHYPIDLELQTEISNGHRPYGSWIMVILGILVVFYFKVHRH